MKVSTIILRLKGDLLIKKLTASKTETITAMRT